VFNPRRRGRGRAGDHDRSGARRQVPRADTPAAGAGRVAEL